MRKNIATLVASITLASVLSGCATTSNLPNNYALEKEYSTSPEQTENFEKYSPFLTFGSFLFNLLNYIH